MSNDTRLEEQLKSAFSSPSSLRVIEGGEQHYQRTLDCPSISELIARRFTPKQSEHVRECVYCSKIIRAATHPWLAALRGMVTRAGEPPQTARLAVSLPYSTILVILIVQTGLLIALGKTVSESAQGAAALLQEAPRRVQGDAELRRAVLAEQRKIEALLKDDQEERIQRLGLAEQLKTQHTELTVLEAAYGELATGGRWAYGNESKGSSSASSRTAETERWVLSIRELQARLGSKERSWIALPMPEPPEGLSESSEAGSASYISAVASAEALSEALRSTPLEIDGELYGDQIRADTIRFLPGPAGAHPMVRPGLVLDLNDIAPPQP